MIRLVNQRACYRQLWDFAEHPGSRLLVQAVNPGCLVRPRRAYPFLPCHLKECEAAGFAVVSAVVQHSPSWFEPHRT
jgi:hypothetical protein